jgi:excisionase family DNA binding protein
MTVSTWERSIAQKHVPAQQRREEQMQKITGTMRQASEASGLSIRKLYDLIARGKLKSVKVGRRRLINWRSLEEHLLGKPIADRPNESPAKREATAG